MPGNTLAAGGSGGVRGSTHRAPRGIAAPCGLPDGGIARCGLPDGGIARSGLPDRGTARSGLPDRGLPPAATPGAADMEHEHEEEHEHETDTTGATDSAAPLALSAIVPISASETLDVVATTSIVGDVVSNIGGDAINLTVLMPPGTDPHAFEPAPQDIAAVADADIVFVNGVGLEGFLDTMLVSAGAGEGKVIHVSHGIELLAFAPGAEHEHEHEHEGDNAEAERPNAQRARTMPKTGGRN
ncbi:MAG: zinc ABC transporter solute-binding protein, partial [Chloroflexaceae bacterium]|nr:zinc ABC transporter solute-binding protein [Chloroflexaceae bacterium]